MGGREIIQANISLDDCNTIRPSRNEMGNETKK